MSSVRKVENSEGVPPSLRSLVVKLLRNHGSATVQRVLADSGIKCSYHAIDAVRRVEEKNGRRIPLAYPTTDVEPIKGPDITKSVTMSSDALAKATLRAIEELAQREGLSPAHAMDLVHMGRDRFEAARARSA